MRVVDTIIEALSNLKKLEAVIPWFGYLFVSCIGGAAAYIKEWEKDHPSRSIGQHVWALIRKLLLSLVAGYLWYTIVVWQGMSGSPLSYLGATLVGLYSGEFLDFLWVQMKSRLQGAKDNK